jgi:DUF4097 and DUF4098 domain-containing protein YvlB
MNKKEYTMTQQVKKPVYSLIGVMVSITLMAGCVLHVGAGESTNSASKGNSSSWSDGKNYSEVNKSIRISDGENVGNVSTVNGSLAIGDNVSAGRVTSVNGKLRAGTNATVSELSTVNGSLSAESGLRASGNVSTVNGSIKLYADSEVGGSVSTVNGSIKLEGVSIDENIETVNGSIDLTDGTRVKGDITFQWNKNNYGKIYLERPVELKFADESLKDKVVENFK